jgi:hypothetical protein
MLQLLVIFLALDAVTKRLAFAVAFVGLLSPNKCYHNKHKNYKFVMHTLEICLQRKSAPNDDLDHYK